MKNWVEELPVLPLSELIDNQMREIEKYGPMPGHGVTFLTYYVALRERIQRTNVEILEAKTRDDVAAAETRLKMLKGEEQKMRDGLLPAVIEGLLIRRYGCVGYLRGIKCIIPANAWSGEVDWQKETLTCDTHQYTRLRTIAAGRLTPEQKSTVEKYLQGETEGPDTVKTGAPGRPSSMHIIEAEFQRRKESGSVAESLNSESAQLEAWFKKQYPDKPPVTAKTIANRLRDHFRAYQKKSA